MKIQDPRPVTSGPALRPTAAPASHPEARQAQAVQAEQAAARPAAQVLISAQSRELHQAIAAAEAAPDVRADKVADARQRLGSGTYSVDSGLIAQRMLDRRA